MQNRNLAIALVLATSIPMLTIGGGGCGGTSSRTGTGGKDGGAGTTGAAGAAGTTGAAGAAGTTGAAGMAGTTGAAGIDAAAGTGAAGMDAAAGSDAGTVMDATTEPLPPQPPDSLNQMSWYFPTDLMGWKYTRYGSTPGADSPINLALTSTLVWDGTNEADGMTPPGSIKGTVPFTHIGERIDFQAFSMAPFRHDWTGYIVKAKVKLVSGGNLKPGCPLRAFLYVSGSAPEGYQTPLGPPMDLVTGSWVSLSFDMADAGANVAAMVSQMGVQIETGGDCAGTTPDGGADGGTDAVADGASDASDAGTDAVASDAADGGADAASDAATDLLVDAGLGDVIDAVATDADIDASDASDASDGPAPLPITATTAVILIDSVTALLK